MDNELKEVADELEKDISELGDDPKEDDDATDWKAEALRARGIAKRNATRLEKLKKGLAKIKTETPPTEPLPRKKEEKTGFDYAEKAFLRANDIKPDEYDLVMEVMAGTGKSIDDVLESKYFQAELKERREAKATKDAIPPGSKRSATSTQDTVEYWIAKGALPPADQTELRRKVVNERLKQEQNKTKFTQNPVV